MNVYMYIGTYRTSNSSKWYKNKTEVYLGITKYNNNFIKF